MRNIKYLFASLLISFPLMAKDIYEAIDPLKFDPSGYFACEGPLDTIFRSHDIKTVVELGSWAGASTRFFGFRVGKEGTVYAVDHWLGTPGHLGEQTDSRLPHIYQLFLSNIRDMGLSDRIVPLRMSTEEAAKALRHIQADLVYVDASRDTNQVYQDIMTWYAHLNEDGVMCGTEWRDPGVKAGVNRAAKELGKSVQSDRKGHFWKLVP